MHTEPHPDQFRQITQTPHSTPPTSVSGQGTARKLYRDRARAHTVSTRHTKCRLFAGAMCCNRRSQVASDYDRREDDARGSMHANSAHADQYDALSSCRAPLRDTPKMIRPRRDPERLGARAPNYGWTPRVPPSDVHAPLTERITARKKNQTKLAS